MEGSEAMTRALLLLLLLGEGRETRPNILC